MTISPSVLLRMRNISDKRCTELKPHVVSAANKITRRNMAEPDRRKRHYNITQCFSTVKMVSQKRLYVTLIRTLPVLFIVKLISS
jgi:cobalamin biosynthesis protein CobT